MNLFNCEHPNVIRNPHTGQSMTVPCGKCNACLKRRAISWIDRLETERKCHPYTVFFTLTYSDDFVPRYHIKGHDLIDYDTAEIVHIPDMIYDSSKDYLSRRDSVCHPRVSDIQNFIKRIRSKVNYNETEVLRKNVRYFIVSEYGPTLEKHRVHYHGLLFFDSYWFARNYKEVINAAWSTDNRSSDRRQIGFTQSRFVADTNGSWYTAAYMYYTSDLPEVYRLPCLKSVKLCSRHAPLGSLLVSTEDLQRYFFDGVTRVGEYSTRTASFVYKPLSPSIKNKLFPKIKGFAALSHYDRVRLYGFVLERQSEIGSFSEFLDYIKNLRFKLDVPAGVLQTPYLYHESKRYVDKFLYEYFMDMTPPVAYDDVILNVDPNRYRNISQIQRASRFYSAVRRVYYNMLAFKVPTVDEYVRYMEKYFDNCEKQNLLEQYDMCEHYEGDKSDLDFLDIGYAERHGLDYTKCQSYIDLRNKCKEVKTKGEKKKEKYAYMRKYNYRLT